MNVVYSIVFSTTRTIFKLFNRSLRLGKSVKIDPRAFIARGGEVFLGDYVDIKAGAMLLPSEGHIEIGCYSSINHYVVINGYGGVAIGNNVLIAAFTSIFSSNHIYKDINLPIRNQGLTTKGGVIIKDDVWVGTHCVILDGVTIGEGSVIAAGSVVVKDVLPYSIMAGVPAKCIGNRKEAVS